MAQEDMKNEILTKPLPDILQEIRDSIVASKAAAAEAKAAAKEADRAGREASIAAKKAIAEALTPVSDRLKTLEGKFDALDTILTIIGTSLMTKSDGKRNAEADFIGKMHEAGFKFKAE